MTYLQEIVNQKVNVLMKTKIEINLNRKSDVAFLTITLVFKKVMFHFVANKAAKFSVPSSWLK